MMKIRPLLLLSISACTAAALLGCQPQSPTPADTTPAVVSSANTAIDAPAVNEPDRPISRLHARGNEPFWSVKVDGDTLTYTTPEMQPGKQLTAERSDHAAGVTFNGTDGDKAFVLDVTGGQCQDSMSGEMFEYTSSFTYGDTEMTGCADAGSE
ncbi:COG3650 family protein [Lysobacter sp. A289]